MVKAYLMGEIGCDEWFLHRQEPQQEEGFEILEGEFHGNGLSGYFRCEESGCWIKVVEGVTSGRWMDVDDPSELV